MDIIGFLFLISLLERSITCIYFPQFMENITQVQPHFSKGMTDMFSTQTKLCNRVFNQCRCNKQCKRDYNEFKHACPATQCLKKARQYECEQYRDDIKTKYPSFQDCFCFSEQNGFDKCVKIYNKLFSRPCTEFSIVETTGTTAKPSRFKDFNPLQSSGLVPTGTHHNGESQCSPSLNDCLQDSVTKCSNYLLAYLEACNNGTNCDQFRCRSALRDFINKVPARLTHQMFFCYCPTGDTFCQKIRTNLNPQCARGDIEQPLPSCRELMIQCTRFSTLCRNNFGNYKRYCEISDDSSSGCKYKYGLCREAWIGIVGTIIGASCSCSDDGQLFDECMTIYNILFKNTCLDRANHAYYNSPDDGPDDQDFTARDGCNLNLEPTKIEFNVSAGQVVRIPKVHRGCLSTEECICSPTEVLTNCREIPCIPRKSCNMSGVMKGHGFTLNSTRFMECMCFSGEVVCAIQTNRTTSPCMFLGYSTYEVNLMYDHVTDQFSPQSVASRLEHLLNYMTKDSISCELDVGNQDDGQIELCLAGQSSLIPDCKEHMSRVVDFINSRTPYITTDVVLSVIKVAFTNTRLPVLYEDSVVVVSDCTDIVLCYSLVKLVIFALLTVIVLTELYQDIVCGLRL